MPSVDVGHRHHLSLVGHGAGACRHRTRGWGRAGAGAQPRLEAQATRAAGIGQVRLTEQIGVPNACLRGTYTSSTRYTVDEPLPLIAVPGRVSNKKSSPRSARVDSATVICIGSEAFSMRDAVLIVSPNTS